MPQFVEYTGRLWYDKRKIAGEKMMPEDRKEEKKKFKTRTLRKIQGKKIRKVEAGKRTKRGTFYRSHLNGRIRDGKPTGKPPKK